MAEQLQNIERCLMALTEIVANQNQQSLRATIARELKYLPTFTGEAGTLPSFIESVERTLNNYPVQAIEVYNIIYQEKIGGSAKNFLGADIPATWEECKMKLKIHYRPTRDQRSIIQEISTLKVNTISELLNKIQNIINYITEYAAFSSNQVEVITSLSCMLVLKIKEIAAGALAAELFDKFELSAIRPILYKYIGQDRYNLNTDIFPKSHKLQNNLNYQKNKNHNQNFERQNRPQQFMNNNNFRYNQARNNSNQFRSNNQFRNNYNYNQFRNNTNDQNNHSRPQPMEVDNINSREEVNQIIDNEFFTN